MNRLVLIAALLTAALAANLAASLAAPAQAKDLAMLSHLGPEVLCQILQPCQPPARYASGAFIAPPVIRNVSLRQVQAICGGTTAAAVARDGGANFGIMGCAQLTATGCIVHVPGDFKAELPDLYRLVLAHELGHCRGWVHKHY